MCCGAERPLRGITLWVILPGRTHRKDWTRHLGPKTLGWSARPNLSEKETRSSVSKSRLLAEFNVHVEESVSKPSHTQTPQQYDKDKTGRLYAYICSLTLLVFDRISPRHDHITSKEMPHLFQPAPSVRFSCTAHSRQG